MKHIQLQLQIDLAAVVAFFSSDEMAKQLPFMHSFPANCCEITSAIAAQALAARYSEASVVRVHGTHSQKDEHHFWVEVGDYVVDSTAHQFGPESEPTVCVSPGRLVGRFPSVQRESPGKAVAALGSLGVSVETQASIVARLSCRLGPTPSVMGASFAKVQAAPHVEL